MKIKFYNAHVVAWLYDKLGRQDDKTQYYACLAAYRREVYFSNKYDGGTNFS